MSDSNDQEFSNSEYKKGQNIPIGPIYHLKLLTFFAWRGMKNGLKFATDTEIEEAGKFDDIVIQYFKPEGAFEKKVIRFIQAKHATDSQEVIKYNSLLSTDGSYGLAKYFQTYRNTKLKKSSKSLHQTEFFMCTNRNIDENDFKKNCLEVVPITTNDLFLGRTDEENNAIVEETIKLDSKYYEIVADVLIKCLESDKKVTKSKFFEEFKAMHSITTDSEIENLYKALIDEKILMHEMLHLELFQNKNKDFGKEFGKKYGKVLFEKERSTKGESFEEYYKNNKEQIWNELAAFKFSITYEQMADAILQCLTDNSNVLQKNFTKALEVVASNEIFENCYNFLNKEGIILNNVLHPKLVLNENKRHRRFREILGVRYGNILAMEEGRVLMDNETGIYYRKNINKIWNRLNAFVDFRRYKIKIKDTENKLYEIIEENGDLQKLAAEMVKRIIAKKKFTIESIFSCYHLALVNEKIIQKGSPSTLHPDFISDTGLSQTAKVFRKLFEEEYVKALIKDVKIDEEFLETIEFESINNEEKQKKNVKATAKFLIDHILKKKNHSRPKVIKTCLKLVPNKLEQTYGIFIFIGKGSAVFKNNFISNNFLYKEKQVLFNFRKCLFEFYAKEENIWNAVKEKSFELSENFGTEFKLPDKTLLRNFISADDFLNDLVFLITPNQERLGDLVSKEICEEKFGIHNDVAIFDRFKGYALESMLKIQAKWVTYNKWAILMNEIGHNLQTYQFIPKSLVYRKKLDECEGEFQDVSTIETLLNSDNQLIHIEAKEPIVSAIKINQVLKNSKKYQFKNSYIFCPLSQLKDNWEDLSSTFGSRESCNLLIIINDETEVQLNWVKILEALINSNAKKVVIVAPKNSKPFLPILCISKNCSILRKSHSDITTAFRYLTEVSKQAQLRKMIIFQKNKVILGDLINIELATELIDPHTLAKLFQNSLSIGKIPDDSVGYDESYFINRNFVRNNEQLDEEEFLSIVAERREATNLSTPVQNFKKKAPEGFDDVSNKTMTIICDDAGTGKTTNLSRLARRLKERSPNHWLIRINLNELSNVITNLNNSKLRNNEFDITKIIATDVFPTEVTENYIETAVLAVILKSKRTPSNKLSVTKMYNAFEKNLFLNFLKEGRLILLFDDFDEIELTEIVKDGLKMLKEKTSNKIILASRPEYEGMLKDLDANIYRLSPFSDVEQHLFLFNFWKTRYSTDEDLPYKELYEKDHFEDAHIKRLDIYVTYIFLEINKLFERVKNSFFTNPLHLQIVAEVFQSSKFIKDFMMSEKGGYDGCYDYVFGNGKLSKITTNYNLAKLLAVFVKHRSYKYYLKGINESVNKYKPNKNQKKIFQIVYELQFEFHKKIASEMLKQGKHFVVENDNIDDFKWQEQMGFIKITNNQGIFVHRAFAEFFAASYFVDEYCCAIAEAADEKKNFILEDLNDINASDLFYEYFSCLLYSKTKVISDDEISLIMNKLIAKKYERLAVYLIKNVRSHHQAYLNEWVAVALKEKCYRISETLLKINSNLNVDKNLAKNTVEKMLKEKHEFFPRTLEKLLKYHQPIIDQKKAHDLLQAFFNSWDTSTFKRIIKDSTIKCIVNDYYLMLKLMSKKSKQSDLIKNFFEKTKTTLSDKFFKAAIKTANIDAMLYFLTHSSCNNYYEIFIYVCFHEDFSKNFGILKILLSVKPDKIKNPYDEKETLLHIVLNNGISEDVLLALFYLFPVDCIKMKNSKGKTPIMIAIINDYSLQMIKFLISQSSNKDVVNIKNKYGYTCLDYAIENMNSDLIEYLILDCGGSAGIEGLNKSIEEFVKLCKSDQIKYCKKIEESQDVKNENYNFFTRLCNSLNRKDENGFIFRDYDTEYKLTKLVLDLLDQKMQYDSDYLKKCRSFLSEIYIVCKGFIAIYNSVIYEGYKSVVEEERESLVNAVLSITRVPIFSLNTWKNKLFAHENFLVHKASSIGYYKTVRKLLSLGLSYNLENESGETPERNYIKVKKFFELMDDAFDAVENRDLSKLSKSLIRDSEILTFQKQCEGKAEFLLTYAIEKEQWDIAKLLMLLHSEVIQKSKYYFNYEYGILPLFYIDAKYQKALFSKGKIKAVILMVKTGNMCSTDKKDNINTENECGIFLNEIHVLFDIVMEGNVADFKDKFKKLGSKMEAYLISSMFWKYGNSLLHCACLHDNFEVYKYLLEKGAIYDLENRYNIRSNQLCPKKNIEKLNTAIDECIKYVRENKVVKIKRHFKKNFDLKPIFVKIRTAVRYEHVTCGTVKTRLNARTLLHESARSGHLNMVKFLCENGADVNATDMEEMKPVDYANAKFHEDVVEYLRAFEFQQ